MYLLYVGVTHRVAPLSVLERVHFSDEEKIAALKKLKAEKSILEDVILSTCNRTELYLVVDQLHTGRYYSKHFLADWFQIDVEELEPYLTFKEGNEALEHLFRVSIGLDSKIVGETQVLGQLKQAFLTAQETGTTGIVLNQAFRQAVTFAKRMHDVYRINARPMSIGLTSLQMLDREDLDYENTKIVVIGLGEIGQLVTKYVLQRPFKSIRLVNRTLSKADPYLTEERIQAYSWDELDEAVKDADIIFTAIKSEGYILYPDMLKTGAIVFDLCLPRTCHPNPSITIHNIENITSELETFFEERNEIAKNIEAEISSELVSFEEWKQQLGIIPLIQEIREKAIQAQESAMESLLRKLPDLTEREKKQISKHMKSIINQILKEPLLQLKEMSVGENSEYDIALIAKIFDLHSGREVNHEKH
ncbi:glutamyl-tRNA reductase [Streptococcus australis]|uniref:Glutamyl-tRNA reductase n=1 Tax=Streptococcus australis ATCC 700641 TaxID=888833 RepID=E7SAV5_9STRE|nr:MULTISPECIES: glutamyl-tRNA reductase [Streptococcus]EFV99214.1 glutamyl-tRNA reductase [Streptococcus australis ATCC 700641]EGU63374.1 glutamyl-tRNA reductase [Streptococcus australis ATCC 700641]MBZ2091146.1 glutamyl-tRNA reductase [Streptococcus parasanguinis]SQH66489.1 glutamyl-tRNA reductase [Streptococcus australis]